MGYISLQRADLPIERSFCYALVQSAIFVVVTGDPELQIKSTDTYKSGSNVMRHHYKIFALSVAICLLLAGFVLAEAPKLISYQGRATDASGNPVADGVHPVQFHIYDKLNNLYWTESASVTTSGGLFSHNLGSVTPLSTDPFNWRDSLFLQVTFEGQVQSPRTLFTASPYAFHVNSVDGSKGGIIIGSISVNSPVADDEVAGITIPLSGSPNLWMKDVDGVNRIKLDAATRSLEFVDGAVTSTPAKITSQGTSVLLGEGKLKVNNSNAEVSGRLDFTGTTGCWIDPNATGPGSVYLPDDGIGAREISDEPGIASRVNDGFWWSPDNIYGQEITYVSITTPAAGYILVQAKFRYSMIGRQQGAGWVQISENTGQERETPYATFLGSLVSPSDSTYMSLAGYISRVYYKPQGTYTFRLVGAELAQGNGNWSLYVDDSHIMALYLPTAYGSVSSLVSEGEAASFKEAQAVQGDAETRYEVDLRELELRAAKAEIEAERARANAEKAKRELLEAQDEASRD